MTERSGQFDYEANPNKRIVRAGDAHIFISDPDTILYEVDRNTGLEMVLDDSTFTDGPLRSSRFGLTQNILDGESVSWDYTGAITHDETKSLKPSIFFDSLEQTVSDTFDMKPFFFNGTHLMYSEHSAMVSAISYNESSKRVDFSNSLVLQGHGVLSEVSIDLSSPAITELNLDELHDQFIDQVRAYVFTLNALAKSLSGKSGRTLFVMTPEGPRYPTNSPKIEDDDPEPEEPEKKIPAIADLIKKPAEQLIMLDDLGGLTEVRAQLKQVAFSFRHPEIMQKWGAERPQGVLLYGPGGTGKTTLARALANEIDAELWEINVTDIYNKWLGDSEKNMKKIFDEAIAKNHPTVMLLDEFDGLIDSAGSRKTGTEGNVVGIFKKGMNTLREKNPNVVVVATTNHFDRMDKSLIRAGRFDIKSYVPLPDQTARRQIFGIKIAEVIQSLGTADFQPFGKDFDLEVLAEKSEEMSGADIHEVLRRTTFAKAIEEASGAPHSPITNADLLAVIATMRKESGAS